MFDDSWKNMDASRVPLRAKLAAFLSFIFGFVLTEGDKSPLADIKDQCISANGNLSGPRRFADPGRRYAASFRRGAWNLHEQHDYDAARLARLPLLRRLLWLLLHAHLHHLLFDSHHPHVLIMHETTSTREARYLASIAVSELGVSFKMMVLSVLSLLILLALWVTIVLMDFSHIDTEGIAHNDFGRYPVAFGLSVGVVALEWNLLLYWASTLIAKYYKARRASTGTCVVI